MVKRRKYRRGCHRKENHTKMRIVLEILVILAILALGIYFLANNHSKAQAWKKIIAIIFIGFSIFAIIFPGIADIIAEMLGIERGTDLILYGLILVVIYLIFSQSLAKKQEQNYRAKIVRRIAILEKILISKKERQPNSRHTRYDSSKERNS